MRYIREGLDKILEADDELKEFNVTFYDGPNSNRSERLIIKAHNSDEAMEKAYNLPQATRYNYVGVQKRARGKIAYMVAFEYNYVFRGKVDSEKGEDYIAFNANNESEARRAYNKKYLGKYFKRLNPGKDNVQEKIPTDVQGGKYGNVFDVYQISSGSLPKADDAQAIINPTYEALGEDYKEGKSRENSIYGSIKSNGIYSLNTGWVKHPVQQDIPDIDRDEFEKEFKIWEDRYFDLLNELDISSQSKLEEIDNLIEDVYTLRKEGMEEDGEYSIKNLIFKEFRNLGYLDNLKELRKEEVSKELSLEQLNEDIQDWDKSLRKKAQDYIPMLDGIDSDIFTEIIDEIEDELNNRQFPDWPSYTSLSYVFEMSVSDMQWRDIVVNIVPFLLETGKYDVYYSKELYGWTGDADYIIVKKGCPIDTLYKMLSAEYGDSEDDAPTKEEFLNDLSKVDKDGNYSKISF